MKTFLSIIVLLSLFVIGCSEQINVNSPELTSSDEPDWIMLPSSNRNISGLSKMGSVVNDEYENNQAEEAEISGGMTFEVTKFVDGRRGETLKIDTDYEDGPFGKVEIKAELKFPKDCFIGTKNITMQINSSFGTATFSPHATFEKCAVYNAEFKGLDLSGIAPGSIDFVYKSEKGKYEKIEESKIEVDLKEGKLKVKDAKLPHFSRYGFIRKAG